MNEGKSSEKEKQHFMETQPLEALQDELSQSLPGQISQDITNMETQPLQALQDELEREMEKIEANLLKSQCEFIRKLVQKHENLSFDSVLRACLKVMKKLPWEKFPSVTSEEEFARELEKLLQKFS